MRDRQISVRRIADELGISKTSFYEIMSDYLGMKKVCTRWVPKFFTSLQRTNRVDCYEELLENCKQDPTGFFDRIVMRVEMWIHHYDPLSQQEAEIWTKSGEQTPVRPRVTQSAGKIITTIFGDCEGVLLVDFLPCDTTINDSYYASLLHRLCFPIREKGGRKLRYGVLLPHGKHPLISPTSHRLLFSTQASPN